MRSIFLYFPDSFFRRKSKQKAQRRGGREKKEKERERNIPCSSLSTKCITKNEGLDDKVPCNYRNTTLTVCSLCLRWPHEFCFGFGETTNLLNQALIE